MRIEEIKALKKGDKFWVDRSGGLSAHFQEKILGLEITPFNLIEITFDHFPKDCWYHMEGGRQVGGYGNLAWFKVRVKGLMTNMHSSSMERAFKSKSECQAITVRNRKWDIVSNRDFKLLAECTKLYPEWFI